MSSLLQPYDGPSLLTRRLFAIGRDLVKEASEPVPVYNLAGTLYYSPSGYLLLSVPNALVRGVFGAMHEPGVELPGGPNGEPFSAHCMVMRPEELAMIGGEDGITERGKQFFYTLGRLMVVEPQNWPGVDRAYYITVHSPELQALRRSYGLSSLPNEGKYAFHITVAVRRRGVLARSETAKGQAASGSSGPVAA